MAEDRLENAREQAKSQYESIAEMVRDLLCAQDDEQLETYADDYAKAAGYSVGYTEGDESGFYYVKDDVRSDDLYDSEEEAWLACVEDNDLRPDEDEARQRIDEDPLSVQVSGSWTPGETPEADKYEILLCTGGPAVRIVGDLGLLNEPSSARLECQDWFTPWTEVFGDWLDRDILLTYAQQFYFGD